MLYDYLKEFLLEPFVAKFIEANINLIEKEDWQSVFLNWYTVAIEIWPDYEEFENFIDVLVEAGIEYDRNVLDSVVTNILESILLGLKDQEELMDDENTTHKIFYQSVINAMNSQLGYTMRDLRNMIHDVGIKHGMAEISGGLVWEK